MLGYRDTFIDKQLKITTYGNYSKNTSKNHHEETSS